MMKKDKREVRKMIRWAKALARDKRKYEVRSIRLFRKYGRLEGFEYRGWYDIEGRFYGDDYIIITDPMGESHTYYLASDKKSYESLEEALALELEIRYRYMNEKR